MTRVRKVFLSIGLVALLIGGTVTIVPPLLWGDHVDYSHVASIKGAREYQDPALQKLSSNVSVLRGLDLASFRDHLRHANDVSRRYVVNFTRGPLFGTSDGHHSPIAGYLVDEDLVLVLDVNKKYGPWLVKSERLYDAMKHPGHWSPEKARATVNRVRVRPRDASGTSGGVLKSMMPTHWPTAKRIPLLIAYTWPSTPITVDV
jgi:hypothetical protein